MVMFWRSKRVGSAGSEPRQEASQAWHWAKPIAKPSEIPLVCGPCPDPDPGFSPPGQLVYVETGEFC